MKIDISSLIEFTHLVGKIKEVPRTGWVNKGINRAESVADHMYRSALLCMVLGDLKGLDGNKMMRMAILDDLAEVLTGDLVPEEQAKMGEMSVQEKDELAIRKILSILPKELQDQYIVTWKESREHKTPESKLAREIEKLEMVFQALEYESKGFDREKLNEFWPYVKARISDPDIIAIFEKLSEKRQSLHKG